MPFVLLASILLYKKQNPRRQDRDHYAVKEKTMATDLTTLQAAAVVDARGSACPGPLLEAKKAIGRVKVGEVLEVLSNDPGTKSDMPLWAMKVGHEFLGSLAADGYDRIFVVRRK
jgi:tRNA 2-thiouridine synthesizing protein A